MKAKAILLGLGTGFILDVVLGYLSVLILGSLAPQQFKTLGGTMAIRFFGIIVAVIMGFLSGYVAGRVAKSAEITHAATVGAIIAGLGFLFMLLGFRRRHGTISGLLMWYVFEFTAAVFGGWLANWRNEKSNRVSGSD